MLQWRLLTKASLTLSTTLHLPFLSPQAATLGFEVIGILTGISRPVLKKNQKGLIIIYGINFIFVHGVGQTHAMRSADLAMMLRKSRDSRIS